QWGESGVTKKQGDRHIKEDIPVEELKKIIDDIAAFRPNVTLFGGEPLLYKNCMEIIRYVKKKGMHCLMITNGSLIEGLAEELVDSGLDELNVSIDGKMSLHDEIRGMQGLYEKIINGLRQVNRFRMKKNMKRPLINLQCTITRHNYHHPEQMTEVAREAGADSLTFHNLIFISRDIIGKQQEVDKSLNCSSVNWEGFVFEPGIEPDVLYTKIEKIRNSRYGFPVDFYPDFSREELEKYYQNPSCLPAGNSLRCVSPWMTAYIFPDGELRPCLNFDYSFGNLGRDKFSLLWNNEQAIKYRRMLKAKKIFPVCVRCTELYRY
ncbi:MAG TPA: radical SAM protein, partial [Nitrospirae bacterium]|nr:radical SAM protein [Nitrospirota bacterium]